ncbi:MAG: hypothetical protein HOC71_09225, partial [Candidatus Latescibacteria bacterium]|nr:hypothetical protein [Candidatus Latescibacterota bacterium]
IGFIILGFGIEMVLEHFWVLPVFSFVMISSWMPIKKLITAPRMGNVVFRKARQTIWLFVMVFLGTFVFAVTLFIAIKRDIMPGLDIFTMYPLLIVSVVFSIPLGAGALYFGINRYYAYIVSIFLVLVPGQLLYSDEPSRVIFIGAAIILYGTGLLFRFIRTYTVPSEET